MNNDLISRSELIKAFEHLASDDYENPLWYESTVFRTIDNAPTVEPEELKPLVDKVVEILPELTNAIIKELPKMVSGEIKCSECSFYKNTWNRIPRPQGEWFVNPHSMVMKCMNCGHEENAKDVGVVDKDKHFCYWCGADMRADMRGEKK